MKIFRLILVTLILTSLMFFTACSPKTKPASSEAVVDSRSSAILELSPENTRYLSIETGLYSEANTKSKQIGHLTKFTKVALIEEKTNQDGSKWSKIQYAVVNKSVEGWVPVATLTKNIGEKMNKGFQTLDYNPKFKTQGYINNPKQEVKGIYVSLCSAVTNIDRLIKIANETEINAFVIDIKDDNGRMLFKTKASDKYCPEANAGAPLKDIKALVKKLHDNHIYLIARIVTFKDPSYAERYPGRTIKRIDTGETYTNKDGLPWCSAYDRQLWAYDVAVAKEAADAGFNEIQFDYVRFPAIAPSQIKNINYQNAKKETKAEAIQKYLKYAYEELSKKNVYVSADIYGQVGSTGDDMGIGQYWESVSNEVDYVSPMMYPSHYGKGVYGLGVPDQYPYKTLFACTKDSLERNKNIPTPAEIRPWIQDFTATWVRGHISYGTAEVKAQIKALNDLGIHQYMLWNPMNKYSVEALK